MGISLTDLVSLFKFTYNQAKEEVLLSKGQTLIIKEFNWRKMRNIKKAITMNDDSSIKVTYLD